MKTILLIAFVTLIGFSATAQKFKAGCYYDNRGNVVNGLLSFEPANHSQLKYKSHPKEQAIKIYPSELVGFRIKNDSFAVLKSFRYEWNTGELHDMNVNIVQVLATGDVTLYKYFAVQGNLNYRGYSSFPYKLEGFLARTKEGDAVVTLRKNDDKRLREQLASLFNKDTKLLQKVYVTENLHSHIPLLVREFNSRH